MKPAIWRRVELPATNSLKTLHLAIQACMLFENYHLFRFDIGDAAHMRISKLVERGITSFTYTYDFGDDWRHRIEIEEIIPEAAKAMFRTMLDLLEELNEKIGDLDKEIARRAREDAAVCAG